MSDREMLEFAAKAAGIDYHATREDGTKCIHDGRGYWNPITDDGDALRLAGKLKFDILYSDTTIRVYPRLPKCIVIHQEVGDDPYAATRRAIVRAAAEIGRQML